MHSEQVSVGYSHEIGEGWAHAIETKRFERIARFCQPDVRSRLMTPRRFVTLESAGALAVKLQEWFGESDAIKIQRVEIHPVGDKLSISYRLLVREKGEELEVEQQIFGIMQDGLLSQLDLMCSGFRSISVSNPTAQPVREGPSLHSALPTADAILIASDEGNGSLCATLTPSIKARLRELNSGQVLRVEVQDTSVRDDIEAWSRLSGNRLLTMTEDEQGKASFFLMKK